MNSSEKLCLGPLYNGHSIIDFIFQKGKGVTLCTFACTFVCFNHMHLHLNCTIQHCHARIQIACIYYLQQLNKFSFECATERQTPPSFRGPVRNAPQTMLTFGSLMMATVIAEFRVGNVNTS